MCLDISPWTRVAIFNICGTTWSPPTFVIAAKSYKNIIAFFSFCLCALATIGHNKGNHCMGLQSSCNSSQVVVL
jgi:hypothetical protein